VGASTDEANDQAFSGQFELNLYYIELQKLSFSRGFMSVEY